MIKSKIIKDSKVINSRIVSLQVRLPTIILAELNTHRVFSRNASSLRAIPVKTIIDRVEKTPFIPSVWTSNKSGMQGDVITDEDLILELKEKWINSSKKAIESAKELLELGAHKQITNRLLMPYTYTDDIITSTKWENFFNLRLHEDAEPHIRELAVEMKKAMNNSDPDILSANDRNAIHLPYVTKEERSNISLDVCKKISVARCARVSYRLFNGNITDIDSDINLFNKLKESKHASPFEHVATVDVFSNDYRNFDPPWKQLRILEGL